MIASLGTLFFGGFGLLSHGISCHSGRWFVPFIPMCGDRHTHVSVSRQVTPTIPFGECGVK